MAPARRLPVSLLALTLFAACTSVGSDEPEAVPQHAPQAADATAATPPAEASPHARPDWLGTRPLPLRPDGLGEILPTPPELEDRRLEPPGLFPAPQTDEFAVTVNEVPQDVAGRSTWGPHCPVGLDQLRYLTVTFWGFDDRAHTGELLVHASAADDMVHVFRTLHDVRYPIEEMRVVAAEELDLHPTGDGNNTTAFVCRSKATSSGWSEHAQGLAVDINPFHNPYLKGDIVIPELASAYADREWDRPGMIHAGDPVTRAFAEIGWGWGGNWRSAKDPMHFSRSGR